MKQDDDGFPVFVTLTAVDQRDVQLFIYDKEGKPMKIAGSLLLQLHDRGYVGASAIPDECVLPVEPGFQRDVPVTRLVAA